MQPDANHIVNTMPQALSTEAFVLPELTLIPFEPGQHLVSIVKMDRPFRDIGGTSFPNVLISVLPGPGQATIGNGQSSWVSNLDESVVVDVQIPGAILVFLTIRPTDYETTGLHIQIKKIEAKQDVAEPVQIFGRTQEHLGNAQPRQGGSPFGQTMTTPAQDGVAPLTPFTAPKAPQFGSARAESHFTSQTFARLNSNQGNIAPLQAEDSANPLQVQTQTYPQFATTPLGQKESPFTPFQKPLQATSPLPQAKPFSSVLGVGKTPPVSDGQADNNIFAYSPVSQQAAQPSAFRTIPSQEEHPNSRPFAPFFQPESPRPEVKPVLVHACAHIQNQGDVPCGPGQSIGTPFSQFRLEAVAFKPNGIDPAQFEYATVSHDGRLSPWTSFPHFSGSRGSSMPLLGFIARLTGEAAEKYHVVYSGSFLKAGQASEVISGQFLHSSIQGDALESLSLKIVPKN